MSTHPITEFRASKPMTQADLARELEVTRWTINQIERGKRQPSIALSKRISAVTGIPIEELRPDVFEPAQ